MKFLSYRNFNKLKLRQPFNLRSKGLDQIGTETRYDPALLKKGLSRREDGARPNPFLQSDAIRRHAVRKGGGAPIWFLIVLLFLISSLCYAHLCHDPFIPRDHLILVPEVDLVRMEREGEFRIFIDNTFRSILENVELFVTNPAFEIEIEPRFIRRLMPGERTFFTIRLKLREGFRPGDYPLRISVGARSAILRPSIETIKAVAEEIVTEPPVQPVPPEIIIPEIEPEVKPPEPVIPPEEKVLKPEEKLEPPTKEKPEPQVEDVGEVVVRVEEFVLARRWYLYLIPLLLLLGLLIYRRWRQK